MQFAKKDAAKIPEHWRTIGTRSSPLTGRPRSASNPINALHNYAYAILETEVRLAILTIGLDPGMGLLHADQKSRDSFVFDVIEPLRSIVDGYILSLLQERSFAAREFFETRQGVCRLMPPLPKALAEMSPQFAKIARPIVEQVAQRLAQGQGTTAQQSLTIPTLLTEANRSAGRDGVRANPKRKSMPELTVPLACKACGVVLERRDRDHCDDCTPEAVRSSAMAFREAGRAKLKSLRAAGEDPAHGTIANRRRSEKLAQWKKEVRTWEAAHGGEADPEVFRQEILPRLQGVSLGAMAKTTGLSEGYCSFIRRGLKIPHRRHWRALRAISLHGDLRKP